MTGFSAKFSAQSTVLELRNPGHLGLPCPGPWIVKLRDFYSKHHHQLLDLHRHRLLPIPALVNLYHFLHESGRQLDVFQTQGVSCHQLLVRELIQVSLQKLFQVTVREHYRVIGLAMLRYPSWVICIRLPHVSSNRVMVEPGVLVGSMVNLTPSLFSLWYSF